MSAVTVYSPSLWTLLRLGRISNLPTVWTNVIAGSVIAGGAGQPAEIVLVALAMSSLYIGGMYLNDFFDRAIDARERPDRPIVAGEINAGTVSVIGFGLLATGVGLMMSFGFVAMLWGTLLAGAIVLYDIWHKGNAISPLVMGLCRALVYLGAGVAIGGSISGLLIVGALALAAHVMGLTYAAKQESLDQVGNLWPLGLLAAPLLVPFAVGGGDWLVVLACVLLVSADAVSVWLLAKKSVARSVSRAVSGLIAAICLVDVLAVALAGGDLVLVFLCAAGYPLTRLFQTSIPGT